VHSSYTGEYQIRLFADAINTLERIGVMLRIPPAEQSPKTGETAVAAIKQAKNVTERMKRYLRVEGCL
jgi:hypothetical protein